MAPSMDTEEERATALHLLESEVKALSTHGSDDSRVRTMASWLQRWDIVMFPPTVASYKAIAATLKSGGYRSAHVYLQVYRSEAERRGFATTVLQVKDLKDAKRSCARGLGAPARPRPLPLKLLGELPAGRGAWCTDGASESTSRHHDGVVVALQGSRALLEPGSVG